MTSPSEVLVDLPEGALYVYFSISFILWSMIFFKLLHSVNF